jgi:hypothetical protein
METSLFLTISLRRYHHVVTAALTHGGGVPLSGEADIVGVEADSGPVAASRPGYPGLLAGGAYAKSPRAGSNAALEKISNGVKMW